MATFPITRLRRLRQNNRFRLLVQETELSIHHLIYPLFISEEVSTPHEILSMPGIMQWPISQIAKEVKRINHLGIPAVLLFGIPKKKDAVGSQAYDKNGIIQKAINIIKSAAPELLVITDICL